VSRLLDALLLGGILAPAACVAAWRDYRRDLRAAKRAARQAWEPWAALLPRRGRRA